MREAADARSSPTPAPSATRSQTSPALDLAGIQNLLTSDPTKIALVPPDPNRQFVSKLQYKEIFRAGTQADGHGFDFVDPAEETASDGAAGYYAWSPEPGIRFISVDTISEAGVIGPSADGNVDDPQFQWLDGPARRRPRPPTSSSSSSPTTRSRA